MTHIAASNGLQRGRWQMANGRAVRRSGGMQGPAWTTGSGCPMGMMAVVSASKHYGVGGFDHLPEDDSSSMARATASKEADACALSAV